MILASASPRRREILTQAGIAHEVCVSEFNEREITPESAGTPEEYVRRLAEGKAYEVFTRYLKRLEGKEAFYTGQGHEAADREAFDRNAAVTVVLGADTVVAYQGQILNKPVDEADAFRMLTALQGNTHEVYSGVSLCFRYPDGRCEQISFAVCTQVVLCEMTEQEIRDYLLCGEYADKAGAYAIQGRFAANIKEIHGDYYNVVGLPLSAVVEECRKRGICF